MATKKTNALPVGQSLLPADEWIGNIFDNDGTLAGDTSRITIDLLRVFLEGAITTLNASGNIHADTLTGNGSGLTGIAGATGGIINTGSTTIGADSDADGVGVIALQTRGITRMTVKNGGGVSLETGKDYQINNVSVLNTTALGSSVINSSLENVGTLADLTVAGEIAANGGIDLATGNDYQINNVSVLNATTLGSSVVNSSLTSVGTLIDLAVSGDLTVNTDALFVGTNGDAGIGTTSPKTKLQVKGDFDSSSTAGGSNPNKGLIIAKQSNVVSDYSVGDLFGIDFTTSSNTDTHHPIIGIYGEAQEVGAYLGGSLHLLTKEQSDTLLQKRLTISPSGNVGIETSSPAYKLQIGTDSAAKPTTNTWTIASDERIKKNVIDFKDGLDVIMKIRPVNYNYNGFGGKGYDDSGSHIGIIAQELESVAPYMIETRDGIIDDKTVDDFKSYQGHAMPFILVNAIKTLKLENDDLKKRIATLEAA